MRHLLMVLGTVPAVALATPRSDTPLPAPATTEPHGCKRDGLMPAQSGRAEVKRLGELPGGALVLTVLREENGCSRPVIVRYGYGTTTDREQPPHMPGARH